MKNPLSFSELYLEKCRKFFYSLKRAAASVGQKIECLHSIYLFTFNDPWKNLWNSSEVNLIKVSDMLDEHLGNAGIPNRVASGATDLYLFVPMS